MSHALFMLDTQENKDALRIYNTVFHCNMHERASRLRYTYVVCIVRGLEL